MRLHIHLSVWHQTSLIFIHACGRFKLVKITCTINSYYFIKWHYSSKELVPDPVQRDRPLNFHERTGHILPQKNNLLQYYVRDTEQFALENKLVINKQKTKIISFTKSRKWDFPPEVTFSDGTMIEYLSEIKLLGVVVSQHWLYMW